MWRVLGVEDARYTNYLPLDSPRAENETPLATQLQDLRTQFDLLARTAGWEA